MAKLKALPGPATAKKKKNGKGGALVSIFSRLAEDAKVAAAKEPTSGILTIQTAKKKFRYGDTLLPDPLNLIVLAYAYHNAYYDTPYDPEDPQPPACFAVAEEEAELTRHDKAPRSPVGEGTKCSLCPMGAWGSAETGKGKACSNYRGLAVVMADDPALDGDGDLTIAKLNISPTGLAAWSKYVKGLAKIENLPTHGVVTQFSFDAERTTPTVVQVGYEKITSAAVLEKILAKRQQVIDEKVLLTIPDTSPRVVKEKKKGKVKAPPPAKRGGKQAAAGARRY